MAAGRFRQLRLLLWKNWLFSLRSWKTTLLQLLAPLFFLLIVTLLSLLPQGLSDILDPPVKSVGQLPKCQGWNGQGCISLYAAYPDVSSFLHKPSPKKCVEELMHGVANRTGLVYGKDILVERIGIDTNSDALSPLTKMNFTQVAVVFLECNTSVPKLSYTILYNSSRALTFFQLIFGSPNKPDGRVELSLTLDSLFMGMTTSKSVQFSVNTSNFPQLYQQESVVAKQATSATLFLFCAITLQFVMMMYNVVSEKDLMLRQGLKLIGLKDSIYWISWAVTGLLIAFLSTCVLVASGYACQLQFFHNTDFFINFILFFVYSSSMVPLAFFASVFITTVRQAVNTGMVVFVVGMFVISIISNPFIMSQIYENQPLIPVVVLLSFLPPFHLAKAMADIGIAGSNTNINGLPQTPYFYGWYELIKERRVQVFNFNFKPGSHTSITYFNLPPTYISLVCLVGNALLYGMLAWYFDAILQGNHGIPRKWYFFLQPSYWCDCLRPNTDIGWLGRDSGHASPIQAGDDEDDEASNENTALLRGTKSYGARQFALRIDSLVKVFARGGCCCCTRYDAPSVDHLSLNVEENQILALLGHNGAGKTTTINMLIGLLELDEGDAYFYDYSVRKNLDLLRSMLGVCPQHDVLWNDLTALEHMKLFAHLKDIPADQMEGEIATLLEEVKLTKVAKQKVSTFSGGMKRRLSVALSFLGDPKILFLDEPTTGMDPKIRRDIWNLILRSKRNRVTIMTTHSMEEADILGDSIAILARGKLKVMGTSVNLKNTYAGYGIDLIVREESVQDVIDLVREQIPDANVRGEPAEVEGGVLVTFELPPNMNEAIVPLFKRIEGDSSIGSMIVDYSISQTTLEQVFFNVTAPELFTDTAYTPSLLQSGNHSLHSLTHRAHVKSAPPLHMKSALPS